MAAQHSVSEKGEVKALAADRTSQSIQATATLFQCLRNSPSSERVAKLLRDLAPKLPSIKNIRVLLEQMPAVITSLYAHLDNCLHSVKYLHNVPSVLVGEDVGELKSPGLDVEVPKDFDRPE